jgi:outer membrane biosynthesis protein TonB
MRVRYALILILALSYGFPPATAAQAQQSATETGRKVLRKVPAEYPVEARRINLAGTVKVVAVVAPDGSVKKVEPVGGSPILVQAAQNAISRWKYAPGAESKENVELHFTPGN